MVAILDQHGQPIKKLELKESQTAKVGGLHHEFAGHPSRGLTPIKLARIMENAEQGDIRAQHDLFLDMEEKDGHIFSEMSKRKRALLKISWDIVPPRNPSAKEKKIAAEAKELVMDIANIEDVILDALDAIGHGFSCQEIEWQLLGRTWLPKEITHRPQSWFKTDNETRTELRLRDNSMNGQALQPFGWVKHIHKAKSGYLARSGLHRVLAWPYLFKNYSVRDLAEFLEIYGLPLRLGKYPSGSGDDEKATLLRAVLAIGHDAAGIIPDGMEIDFKDAAKGSHDPFQAMIDWCERTQSKAILGGTLTSQADGKSSTNALGNVHNEVRHDLMMSDAMQLAGTLSRDIVYPLIALNLGGIEDARRMPKWQFDLREPEDIKTYSDALPPLVAIGVQVPVNWAHEKLGIPLPKEGEAVLQPAKKEVPGQTNEVAATRIVAATANLDQDEFDLLGEEMSSDWERVTNPLIEPIAALAASVESYEEFTAKLPSLIAGMDISLVTEALTQGQFAASIWGRVNGPSAE
ncbi:MAG: DUF935 domain-containing protein [Methylotenera sp.]|nr:DUF935 domain-containing protein [Methylotenera sp.]